VHIYILQLKQDELRLTTSGTSNPMISHLNFRQWFGLTQPRGLIPFAVLRAGLLIRNIQV
jgi:hypothetical protein